VPPAGGPVAGCYYSYLDLAAGPQYHNLMLQTSPHASPSFQEEATGAIQPGGSDGEQRDNTRYRCQGNVEFVSENTEVRTFAKVTDISYGGCYVEMTATSTPGTEVCLVIEVSSIGFRVRGLVKTSDPCLGMGILFTEISDADKEYLQRLLLALSGDTRNQAVVPVLPANLKAGEAIHALAQLFATQSFITRDEFLHILERFAD
jgi:hypothetical protein